MMSLTKAIVATLALSLTTVSATPGSDLISPPPMLGVGALAPEFVTFTLDGKEVRLADYRGKILILDFWATWCAPCVASMPHTQEIAAKYADQDVVVLAVCTGDKRKRFEDWVQLKAAAYPALRFTFDPHEQGTPEEKGRASIALYGVPGIPTQFIIDREGRIAGSTTGYFPGSTALERALAAAGVNVAPAETAGKAEHRTVLAQTAGTRMANRASSGIRPDAPSATTARPVVAPFRDNLAKVKAGDMLADVEFRAADGTPRKLSDFRGQPLVLLFTPAEMIPADYLDSVVAEYGATGVQVLAVVTRDTEANYQAWLTLHSPRGHRFATAFDPVPASDARLGVINRIFQFGAPTPLSMVVDAEGRFVGLFPWKLPQGQQGLAELLRRCGMPAQTETSAATPADKDFAAFATLQKTPPPASPNEMGVPAFMLWADAQQQKVGEAGFAFYANHPTDPRRWEVVLALSRLKPLFIKETGPDFATQGMKAAVIDEAAKAAWKEKNVTLWQALNTATDVPPGPAEERDWSAFAFDFRVATAALKAGGSPDWAAFRSRFDAHAAKYPQMDAILAKRAGDYLGALERNVPGRAAAEWQYLLDSSSIESLRKLAGDQLKLIALMSQPLEIAFTAVDGRKVDLKDLRGKVVLVDFWATWCGPCIAELPNVKKVYAAYRDLGFEVVGIALENGKLLPKDTPEQTAAKLEATKKILTDFTAKEEMPWPQYFDGKFWKNDLAVQYDIRGIPAMFLLDQTGKVVTTNARGPKLEAEVKRLLKL